MPHVTFVSLAGVRVREEALLELGMSLPGLRGRSRAIGELPALGLLTLAGMLPDDWTCSYQAASQVNCDLVDRIADESPTLVAISALTASIQEAYGLCGALCARGIRTVLGGLHVTSLPAEAGRFADAVVVGSGEPVWSQVINDAAAGRLAPVYRAAKPSGANEWPVPRFDLLGKRPPRFTLQTQRGCPLACDFCGASRLLGPFVEKSVGQIARELDAIRAIDPHPVIELADDNTFAGGRDAAALLATLQAAGLRYFTEFDWRVGERPDVLGQLAESGCVQALVGIESLVFRYPGMGQKRDELGRVMAAVERIQEAGVAVNGCFIVGADGETRHSLDRLVEFILQSPLAEVQLTLQTPFPGTGLYRRLHQQGRLLPGRDWSFYTLFDVVFQPDRMSADDLERGFREVVEAVFSKVATERRSAIRRRIIKQARGVCP